MSKELSVCLRFCRSATVVAAVVVLLVGAPPRQASSEAFPKIPNVKNLTQGFRLEATFSSVAVAPSNPDYAYIGTSNGLVYSSTDGGESWVEHDLIEFPRLSEFPLKPRTGPSQAMHQFLQAQPQAMPNTFYYSRFTGPYNWPDNEIWAIPTLETTTLLEPYQFRPEEIVPGGVTITNTYTGGSGTRLFSRNVAWRNVDPMTAQLGHAPVFYTGSKRKSLNIRWLTVHPNDPETVWAVTNDGLFRSDDAGHSWVREFDNPLADRRISFHVNLFPNDPKTRFLCTKHGLYVTEDDGESYTKVEDSIIARIGCNYVTFHPERPRELWVGAVFGVWVSKNFGETFDLPFYRRIPGQMQIKRIAFDPKNPDNVLLGAKEIAFLSRDGGESYKGIGGLTFASQNIVNVMFGEDEGDLVIATKQDVWRSDDWGETWQSVYFGNTGFDVQWAFFPRGPDGPLWVLSKGELLSLERERPGEINAAKSDALREMIEREPSLSETMIRALRSHDAWRPDLQEYRGKSRWSHLVPKLQLVGSYRDLRPDVLLRGRLYGMIQGGEELPRGYATSGTFQDWHFEAWGNWDLSSFIFDRQVLPKGQNFRYNEKLARHLREDVQLVYSERRRIKIKQIVEPSPSARTRMLREMRVEELTEILDIMTKGWFTRYLAGHARAEGRK